LGIFKTFGKNTIRLFSFCARLIPEYPSVQNRMMTAGSGGTACIPNEPPDLKKKKKKKKKKSL
jgi:hypothetical protein